MNSKRNLSIGAAALMVLFLAACGSSGGLGDILGGGGNTSNQTANISGTVDYVDVNARSITLTNVSGLSSMLSSGGSGSTVRVYYDANTPVTYNGKSYRPEDLERGDQVSARVEQSGNNLVATQMSVTYDARGGSGTSTYPSTGSYPSSSSYSMRGTVRYIDTSRRTIEIDRSTGGSALIEYDANTYVTFNSRQYQVADLERGDEIDLRVSDMGGGRIIANNVDVLRSVSGTNGSTGSSTRYSTIRGTVRYVDTARRTIELEQTSWINRFDSGTGSTSGIITISYPTNLGIEVNGRSEAVTGLQRGDIIDVEVSSTTGLTLYANRLVLVRDVNYR